MNTKLALSTGIMVNVPGSLEATMRQIRSGVWPTTQVGALINPAFVVFAQEVKEWRKASD